MVGQENGQSHAGHLDNHSPILVVQAIGIGDSQPIADSCVEIHCRRAQEA
jgi:hypothetical protein